MDQLLPIIRRKRRPLIEQDAKPVVVAAPAPVFGDGHQSDKPAPPPAEIPTPLSALDLALKKLSEDDSKN